jgi:hypothetical protein
MIHPCVIAWFVGHSILALFGDLLNRSTAMNPVKSFMKEHSSLAKTWGRALFLRPNKPLIKCKNCTKAPEEISNNIVSMLCSTCNIKLQFSIHYCSVYIVQKYHRFIP